MNRSLLLIICDFMLISILSLVRLDSPSIDEPRDVSAEREMLHAQGVQDDMVELLRLSLEEEAAQREALREDLAEREQELVEREAALDETARSLDEATRDRDQTAEELTRIREEREALEAERARLQTEFQSAQATIVQSTEERARMAADLENQRRQAQQLQAELQARQNALSQAEQNLAALEEQAARLAQARNELETDLKITQTERALLQENLQAARSEVETARLERQRAEQRSEQLASNVGALAERSSAIEEEIRRSQPISLNQIYSRYEENRLRLTVSTRVDALFGSREETAEVDAILVRAGGQTLALFESSQTPFRLESLNRVRSGQVQFWAGGQNYEVVELSFLQADPRLIAVQIPRRIVDASGITPFELATEPLRFPEVVLVSNQLGEYGEATFRLLPGGQRYLSVPNRMLGRVFGSDFGASRGDYIFAKTGNLMGVMVSSERGAILSDLRSAGELRLGSEYNQERAIRLQNQLMGLLPEWALSPATAPGTAAPPRR